MGSIIILLISIIPIIIVFKVYMHDVIVGKLWWIFAVHTKWWKFIQFLNVHLYCQTTVFLIILFNT